MDMNVKHTYDTGRQLQRLMSTLLLFSATGNNETTAKIILT